MSGPARLKRVASLREELKYLYRELHFQRRAAYLPCQPASLSRPSPINFECLGQVEDLVLLIEEDDRPPFTVTPRHEKSPEIRVNPVGKVLLQLDEICSFTIPALVEISPRVSLFMEALTQARPDRPKQQWLGFDRVPDDIILKEAGWLNHLVQLVRKGLSDPELRETLRAKQQVADTKYEEASAYLDGLFRKAGGELLIISLELRTDIPWRKTASAAASGASLPDIVEWFNCFRNKGRDRAALASMVGYMGRWERSDNLGLYSRVVFFLKAARVPDPEAAAAAIGKLWQEFSQGEGSYSLAYLSQEDAEKYIPFVQIGPGEKGRRKRLVQSMVLYLTKQELVFRDLRLNFRNRFFKGERSAGTGSSKQRSKPSERRQDTPTNSPEAPIEAKVLPPMGVESPASAPEPEAMVADNIIQEPPQATNVDQVEPIVSGPEVVVQEAGQEEPKIRLARRETSILKIDKAK